MGKKGSSKKAATATSGPQMSVTIREASTGKKHINAKSSLKLQHLKDLAVWASHDAAIPSLGAFFGHHFAAASEVLAAPLDPSLFTCQRCESVLHPGYNCTIRIEKSKTNTRCKGKSKGKKTACYSQNNIVYTCHFCSHRNMKRGTLRTRSLPKVKAHQKWTNRKTGCTVISSNITKDNIIANTIATPLVPIVDDTCKGKNMGIVEISETSEVKDDINSITAPLLPPAEDPYTGKTMGTVEINETLEVKSNSADTSSITYPLRAITDDPMGKMGIVEMNEPLEVKDDSANVNTIIDDPMGKMGIVELNEPLEVKDDSASINTITAPLGSTGDDSRNNMGLVEINETLVVENNSAAFSPTTPSTRPALTPLEIKMKKRYRTKKKVASESTSEAANAENSLSKSNRRRRKSWTSLKEIAKRNENDNSRRRLMNLTVSFSLK